MNELFETLSTIEFQRDVKYQHKWETTKQQEVFLTIYVVSDVLGLKMNN